MRTIQPRRARRRAPSRPLSRPLTRPLSRGLAPLGALALAVAPATAQGTPTDSGDPFTWDSFFHPPLAGEPGTVEALKPAIVPSCGGTWVLRLESVTPSSTGPHVDGCWVGGVTRGRSDVIADGTYLKGLVSVHDSAVICEAETQNSGSGLVLLSYEYEPPGDESCVGYLDGNLRTRLQVAANLNSSDCSLYLTGSLLPAVVTSCGGLAQLPLEGESVSSTVTSSGSHGASGTVSVTVPLGSGGGAATIPVDIPSASQSSLPAEAQNALVVPGLICDRVTIKVRSLGAVYGFADGGLALFHASASGTLAGKAWSQGLELSEVPGSCGGGVISLPPGHGGPGGTPVPPRTPGDGVPVPASDV